MSEANPRIYGLFFEIDDKCYFYDANTGHIMEVAPIVYNLLQGEVTQLAKYNNEDITRARNLIRMYRDKYGVFQQPRFKTVLYKPHEIRKVLNEQLHMMILNITEDCNLRCRYCTFGKHYPYIRNRTNRRMSWRVAKRAIDFLFEHSGAQNHIHISYYGGEPLLTFQLIKEATEYAVWKWRGTHKKLHFGITTNLTLLTYEMLEFFVKHNFILTVSLNGPKEINDRERVTAEGKGTYGLVIDKLAMIKNKYSKYFENNVNYSVVLTPPFDLIKVRDFFNNFDYRTKGELFINLVDQNDTTYYAQFGDDIWQDYHTQVQQLRDDFIKKLEGNEPVDWFSLSFFGNRLYGIHKRQIGLTDYIYPNGACIPGASRTYVSTQGILYPCEKIAERLSVGDVWNGFDFNRVRYIYERYVEMCEALCLNCVVNRLCSMCYVSVLVPKGRHYVLSINRKKSQCESIRKGIIADLKFYIQILSKVGEKFEQCLQFTG